MTLSRECVGVIQMASLTQDARGHLGESFERQASRCLVDGERLGPGNRSAMAEAIHLLVFVGACADA